ncbi:MAG: hypothetical protein GC190_17525 [Alphaproteobacteria bacterium]|nr:hypothetical protein [Alphaproteobacteria bacterium]
MGEEIKKQTFTADDIRSFKLKLKEETKYLLSLFREERFEDKGDVFGLELEAWLLDTDFRPAPQNEAFLSKLNDPTVGHEISQFNFELNIEPEVAGPNLLSRFEQKLDYTWQKCTQLAEGMGLRALMVGIAPTLTDDMLRPEFLSDLNRYSALDRRVIELRDGRPIKLSIDGDNEERLESVHDNILLEAATTSLQVHIQTRPSESVRFYNASQIASAPTVAIAANAPYLFGHDLWDETRIPLFEQSVFIDSYRDQNGDHIGRVKFGEGYCKTSFMELFLENLDDYEPLLPMVSTSDVGWLDHLRLQNGTIWRWNRPIVGVGKAGQFHLRVEHRVCASGPTVTDCMANAAFYIGLTYALARSKVPPETLLSFEDCKSNFYAAARSGFRARIKWLDGKAYDLQALVLDQLLPMAREALLKLGVSEAEVRGYLDEVVRERVVSGRNGAAFQRSFIDVHGRDFQGLAEKYYLNMSSKKPVHTWEV